MSLEPQSTPRENLGALRGCLVEGDTEQRKRERSVRRRALLLSTFLQASVAVLLLLVPLFAKPPRIEQAYLPVPFYSHAQHKRTEVARPRIHRPRYPDSFYAPSKVPDHITTHVDRKQPTEEPSFGAEVPALPGQIPLAPPANVMPPGPPHVERPHVVRLAQIDPAMLIYRVEPAYPVLALHTGRSGRVEMHAIIASDGSLQSLEIVSGDPLFYASALEAVRHWRYKPTMLNGQAVEVDTFITVIYNLQH